MADVRPGAPAAAPRWAHRGRLLGLLVVALITACGVPAGGPVQEIAVPTVGTSPAAPGTMEGRREIMVYFVRGIRLEAVPRQVVERRPQTSLELLLAGPTRAEAVSELRTALSPQDLAVRSGPEGTGTARIVVGGEFTSIDGGNQLLAVAQVVWTVTQFPEVDRVCFSLGGALVEVPTDTGLSAEPVDRGDYVSVAPPRTRTDRRSAVDGPERRPRRHTPAGRPAAPIPGGQPRTTLQSVQERQTPMLTTGHPAQTRREARGPTGRRRALEALLGVPFSEGNRVEVLRNGTETFPALLSAISAATRSIDLLWFAWRSGTVAACITEALADRARAGVRVRVLLDGYGAKHIDRGGLGRMRDAGCEVVFYRPLPSGRPTVWNLRTHRRVLVCDETLAFTGGTGIADAWTGNGHQPGHWRDTAFRVSGPAVAGVRAAFAVPWMQAQARTGEAGLVSDADRFPPLLPAGGSAVQVLRPSSGPGWNDAALAVVALLETACRRVRITTPYVRLPGWLSALVCATASRGVAVQLLVSGPHVERPAVHLQGQREYQTLLDAGVEIWRYQPSLLHAKVLTVDGETAMVGTANLDARSLALNEQVCMLVDDRVLTGLLDAHFEEDLAVSAQVTDHGWRRRPVTHRILEAAADVAGRPLRGAGGAGLTGRRPGW
ncbi:phospholipase D-like domain-containing protein [Geodermatophilus sp. SYSU D01186]